MNLTGSREGAVLTRFQGANALGVTTQAFCDQYLVGGEESLAKQLMAKATLIDFKPGDDLIVQGATDNHIYFLLCGEVAILVHGNEVAKRRAKYHVGEMAMIDPSAKRSATVVATEDTVAARVTEPDFVAIAAKYPKMWRSLAVECSERLRQRGDLIRKRNALPIIFVGSSSEALGVAEPLHATLSQPSVEARLWTLDVFGASNFTIEDLEAQAQQSDFAVLVASPDDVVRSRGKKGAVPRDNVIFELGLFMGACGRKRTFIVQPRTVDLKLPSDLLGLTTIRYDATKADHIQTTANTLAKIFARLGPR
jgi:CRP/FNR family cyclic AMP-dependent transcriptional regulator